MATDVIRVILADDHAVVRVGLRSVLSKAPDIQVIGDATNGKDAVALVERFRPDVAILDLEMAGGDGKTATREIVEKALPTRVLVLTMHSEDEYLTSLLKAGAGGFLDKGAADRELVEAVRAVAAGEVYVRPTAARALAKMWTQRDPAKVERQRFEQLSTREREVFRLVAEGYSGSEIGVKLTISGKTVETYKQRINEKLGLAHRAHYIRLAVRLGLLNGGNAA